MTRKLAKPEVDYRIDAAVQYLRRLVFNTEVELAARVGDYLLEHFFDGDVAAALSFRSDKRAAIAQLADRATEFGMSKHGVQRAIPIALQVRFLGSRLAPRLSLGAHEALLPLRDPEKKRLVAEIAIEERLDRDAVRERVREIQPAHVGGRPRKPPVVTFVGRAHRLAKGVQLGRSAEVTDHERRRLLGEIHVVRRALDEAEQILRRGMRRTAAE